MQTCSRVQVKINTKTAVVSHQFCYPCLVLPVWERASGGGGGVNKVPGLTFIVNNLEMNKQKFTNPAIFLKFNRINCLLSFPLRIDVSTTTSFSIMKKRTC